MATIPIEVIVQDKEVPVVPSEDGTNNTETNITAPDTGTISSSGDISSSASSIILPAILLVLAIGSIVAILIHKYHKQKKDKTSKKEKLAVATSSTIAVFAATVLVGNLVIPATKAATNTTNSISPTEDKITITIDRGKALESSASSTAYATVTTSFGYEVLLAASNSTTNLYLNGDVTSEYYIVPTESTELGTNTWGYSLEDGEDYKAVPLADNAALITKGTEIVENKEFDVYYGAKVSEDLPAGTYKGEIEYILSDSGFPYALRTMQDMTTEICEAAPTPNAFKADGTTIEDIVPTTTLTDIRDNKPYTIAKLADGNCWMTKNLDLQKEDLLAGITLDATNTDHPAVGFVLPDSQTSGNESWGNDEMAINTAHVYDPSYDETKYYYCSNYNPGPGCLEYSDEEVSLKKIGNYYNWYTATAGTGTYDLRDVASSGSICSAGWRIPGVTSIDSNITTEYDNLLAAYNIINDHNQNADGANAVLNIFKTPLLFDRGVGLYFDGLQDVGIASLLWLSYADTNGSAMYFYINPDYHIMALTNLPKNSGSSIRCIAQ